MEPRVIYLCWRDRVLVIELPEGQRYVLCPRKPVYYEMAHIVGNAQKERGEPCILASKVAEEIGKSSASGMAGWRGRDREQGSRLAPGTVDRYWRDDFHSGYWQVKTIGGTTIGGDLAREILGAVFMKISGSAGTAELRLGGTARVEIPPNGELASDLGLMARVIDVSGEVDRHDNLIPRCCLQERVDAAIGGLESGYVVVEGGLGRGKTGFLVDQIRRSNERVVFHFIRRHMGNWDDPEAFLASLYGQLVLKHGLPELDAGENLPSRVRLVRAFVQVSERLPSGGKEIIYLDALDEAFGGTGRYAHLWPGVLPARLPRGVYVVATSRPGRHLDMLADADQVVRLRIEDSPGENDENVRKFLVARNTALGLGLSQDMVEAVVARASGNFLFAAWVIKDLQRLSPDQRMPEHIPMGLGDVMRKEWAQALGACAEKQLSEERFLEVAAVLVAAFEPMTPDHLDELVGLEAGWEVPVHLLEGFFEPGPDRGRGGRCFRFWHRAFAEFIEGELGGARLRRAHAQLGTGCARWEDVIAPSVRQYALRHLTEHLSAAAQWEACGRAFCRPDYLRARVGQGTYGQLIGEAGVCAERAGASDPVGRSLAVLKEFLQRRSPYFCEYPEAIGQEFVNELEPSAVEPLRQWLPTGGSPIRS